MENINKINVSDIVANPLNNRSMKDVDIIAESIQLVGLLHPLVVYEDHGKYVLISGHRRFEALKKLKNTTVDAVIVGKPKTEFEEQELMSQANIHRSSPEEIKHEAFLAQNVYNTMPNEYREKWREALLKDFVEKAKGNEKYNKDPKGFIDNNFRAREEYIKSMTGLDVSNSTVKKLVKDYLREAGEIPDNHAEEEEATPKQKKKITRKNIMKSISSLIGLLEVYECEDIDDLYKGEVFGLMDEAKNILDNLHMSLGED